MIDISAIVEPSDDSFRTTALRLLHAGCGLDWPVIERGNQQLPVQVATHSMEKGYAPKMGKPIRACTYGPSMAGWEIQESAMRARCSIQCSPRIGFRNPESRFGCKTAGSWKTSSRLVQDGSHFNT
jgi:hypothetical protein